ncbi:MAG: hypothetical protein M3326_03920 [Actinomycetota bacterium]|nr:hypothetical protein [Actinomycetota bacterium]
MTVPVPPDVGVRLWPDLGWVAIGAVLLVLSALPVPEHSVSGVERSVFRAVNNAPGVPFAPVWLLMQAGNIAAIGVAAVAALVARRLRLAASPVAAGLLAYAGAKAVEQFLTRGWPDTLVGLARVYVGAYLPLDVVGGAALGLMVGATVRLAFRGPVRCS